MRVKCGKIIGLTIAILAIGSTFIIGGRAQQSVSNSRSSAITTNWVGYLVTGSSDPYDRITSNPSPTIVRQVEVGLRSDGMVIWREEPKAK